MKLYLQMIKLLLKKFILRIPTGIVVRDFCESMGIVYIKLGQILATQNYGNLFTEDDRKILSKICDNSKPIDFEVIKKIIEVEYKKDINEIFDFINPNPVGSASISQVHKARLKTGEIVAVKVKRKDITTTMEKDIKQIKKLMHRFGKFVKFKNYLGGNKGLDLYISWIEEEINFTNELNNLKVFREFTKNMNNSIDNLVNIVCPKSYDELCTSNIIVMEFVEHKTINKLELNDENKEKIKIAMNSYIKLSFHALLKHQQVVFHGDPHGGNIYLDNDGNIGFLDLGLLFILTKEDANMIREYYLSAYTNNVKKLHDMLVPYGNFDKASSDKFFEQLSNTCKTIKSKPITAMFTEILTICLSYEIAPPNFLFCMAKSFLCLNGIVGFTENNKSTVELLKEQTMEYYIDRTLNDVKEVTENSVEFIPKTFVNILKNGLNSGITSGLSDAITTYNKAKIAMNNFDEVIELIRASE